ncbi:MAG: YkgJ family cysteine cluster protein [Proteobacteria bacterium]|nr:YkgJ family cysteine cluster protein [Pseudomonadota bacterium]
MIPEDLDDYRRLVARVDDHAERVTAAWSHRFACRSGCSGCCQRSLSVAGVEASSIGAWIEEHGLAPEAGDGEPFVSPLTVVNPDDVTPCAMLDAGGQCRIYPVRPVICRTHGLPVAISDGEGGKRGDTCPLNFTEAGLGEVPSADFLDLTTLDTVLAAVDLRFSLATGSSPGERVPLSDLADR